jgi:VIT1/CCC1 family predicted Fe2+/Mn2+ transporter
MTGRQDIARYRENLQHELDGAALYRTLAEIEPQPQLAAVYGRLAAAEEGHARHWAEKLREAGAPVPRGPSWRPRILGWLARRFGTQFILPTVAAQEEQDSAGYAAQGDARQAALPGEEHSHARLLRAIRGQGAAGLEGAAIAQLEGRHRATGGNALRAAVLGVNDGLVSNLSLVMGVAGADFPGATILVTGAAGLLAGAGSMALGEWLSVQSARELYSRQISIEAEELATAPEEEAEELALIYQAKGLPEAEARSLASRLIADRGTALDTLAREELGINPEDLGGSAWEAAITSFLLFAVGAIIPVLPFLVWSGVPATLASLVLSGLGLFASGAFITLLTGRRVLVSGSRQVAIGLAAALLI